MSDFRIGHGYDVHRLVPERKLILGGVSIPFTLGLLGHSDADVLLHALMDAIFGALGEGDIGRHFPDSNEEFAGVSSIVLAKKCAQIMQERGYHIVNADATVIAQKPKLAPYIQQMQAACANAFGSDPSSINIKATTEEGLGFTGSMEGIAAHAVVLLSK